MLVASSAPLDQFVVRNPSYFFDAPPEHALINPDNLHILVDHVKCAAFELPFTTTEQYRPPRRAGSARHPRRRAAWCTARRSKRRDDERRRHVAVDERVVSGRRGQPALDLVRQLRRRRHDARRRRHRRDELQQRAVDAAREGDLPDRRRAVSGGEARLRRAQGVRAADRLRLLHRRDHLHEGDGARHVRDRDRGHRAS